MNGVRLGIAGVGLIGGSIALRARAAGAFVVGYDRLSSAVSLARERGAIDAFAPDLVTLAAECDTLVVALPVDQTALALEQLSGVRGPRLILDVASVKGPFEKYAALLPTYVGTHPLAGRERGGVAAADSRLFEDATWAYMPHGDAVLIERVCRFIHAMGARPLEIDAAHHDAIVALTSHLPQALSVALGAHLAAAVTRDPVVTELCGPGMSSMLRLARSPQTMWKPIMTANAGPVAEQLRSVARALVEAADGLDRGDSAGLMSYFEAARSVAGALEERFPTNSRS